MRGVVVYVGYNLPVSSVVVLRMVQLFIHKPAAQQAIRQ